MDRRTLFTASLAAATGGASLVSALPNKDGFQLIDSRLSLRVAFSELKDGEYGYTNVGLLSSKSELDNHIYFPLGSYASVSCKDHLGYDENTQTPYGKCHMWIGKKGNCFYIKPYGSFMKEAMENKTGKFALGAAQLAYRRAYPLFELTDGYYLIPADWNECAKHPYVRRNILALKEAVDVMEGLQEKHGVVARFENIHDHDERLKKALEPLMI